MEGEAVYYEQQVLTKLIHDDLISVRAVAAETGKSTSHIYKLQHGDRRVPTYIWAAILRLANPWSLRDPDRYWAVATPVLDLLIRGTTLYVEKDDSFDADAPVKQLCAEAGVLLTPMGHVITLLGEVLADGKVTPEDDPTLAEFYRRRAELVRCLRMIEQRLKHERAAPRSRRRARERTTA